MNRIFADTSYWLALSIRSDLFHKKASDISKNLDQTLIITNDLVLVELLDSFCNKGSYWRKRAVKTVETIQGDPLIIVEPFSKEIFLSGLKLYKERPDKGYSFVDCVSMVILRRENIKEVLTTDHHFEQEGFTRLLK